MKVLSISVGGMTLLAPTPQNADPLFVLVITPGYYLHHVLVADQVPASGQTCMLHDNSGLHKI